MTLPLHTEPLPCSAGAKVLVVVGSRPEAIKMAPIIVQLRREPEIFDVTLCATGQQRHMAPQALAEFDLTADSDLDVMRSNDTLAGLTARLMTALDATITRLEPSCILVQGDTTSAMVGALAGFYRRVPVGHVEAGMRTGQQYSPFPEEVNRKIIAQCAALHFAPTSRCRDTLLNEGVAPSTVFLTGNTVVDALQWMRARVKLGGSTLAPEILQRVGGQRLLLVTSHRRESFGAGLEHVCQALKQLSESVRDVVILYPVHPNPNVSKPVHERLADVQNIILTEPLPYRALIEVMDRATLILTDSGGLQEEAPAFGKPVLVLRDTTERPEGVDAGVARLVGTDTSAIVRAVTELLSDRTKYECMASGINPYGDGHAAQRIVSILRKQLLGDVTPFSNRLTHCESVA